MDKVDYKIVRDPKDPVPEGLNEYEQQATMMAAVKQRGIRSGEELTVVPVGTPPLSGWAKMGIIKAPGSGNPYVIYMKFPGGHGPGPTGTRHRKPKSDAGTMAQVQNKPNVPNGAGPVDSPPPPNNPSKQEWLGSVESDLLTQRITDLQETLDDPGATEDQISKKIGDALTVAQKLQRMGDEDDPRMVELMKQVGDALGLVTETRNEELQSLIFQEQNSPGSVKDEAFTAKLVRSLSGEKQRQLLGLEDDKASAKTMELVNKAIGMVADRKADRFEDLIKREEARSGSVKDEEFYAGLRELAGVTRQVEMMGMSRAKTTNAMGDFGKVLKILIRRKTEARNKLTQQKYVPGSNVTDLQIRQATDDLDSLKNQARQLGFSEFD